MLLAFGFAILGLMLGLMLSDIGAGFMGALIGFFAGWALSLSQQLRALQQQVNALLLWQKQTLSQPQSQLQQQTPPAISPSAIAPAAQRNAEPAIADLPLTLDAQWSAQPLPPAAAPPIQTPHSLPASTAAANPAAQVANTQPTHPWVEGLRRFFTEGNPIVRIGMLVMFFGLSFLIKYSANQGLFPLELRLCVVAAVALGLISLGWKTRQRPGGFGLVLQGGGVAALYLTLFAATKLYGFIPAPLALGLMLLCVAFGVLLALLQQAQVLALMASAGGFLAPILTSDGSGNQVLLFSFYLLLNLGILAVAWFNAWRLLNWLGFVFTFAIGGAWGWLNYSPAAYLSSQLFLLAFFALYLCLSLLFSFKQPPNLKGLVDGSLVFGLPLIAFGMQAGLVRHMEYGLAFSALLLAAIYALLACYLWRLRTTHRLLMECFIALALGFASLSIPLAFNAEWTSASWALEAVGLVWLGVRQRRQLSLFAGYALYAGAVLALLHNGISTGATPLLSGDFLNLSLLALAACAMAYILRADAATSVVAKCLLALGYGWWLLAIYSEASAHIPGHYLTLAVTLLLVASTGGALLISQRLAWPSAAAAGYWLLPLVLLWYGRQALEASLIGYAFYPSQHWGALGLVALFALHYVFLRRFCVVSTQAVAPKALSIGAVYHLLAAWFLLALIAGEALHWQEQFHWYGEQALRLWFFCLTLPLLLWLWARGKPLWPLTQYRNIYEKVIPAPLWGLSLVWFVAACTYGGSAAGFIPLLNWLDAMQLALLLLFAQALLALYAPAAQAQYPGNKNRWVNTDRPLLILLAAMAFVWLNLVLLRALHQYLPVAYHPGALWQSVSVQMALSIMWSLCALVVMQLSRRLQLRSLWLIGAGLLVLVLIKLFIKDLTGSGTLARIVSFMAVGGLMLLIGYIAPIPARAASKSSAQNTPPTH